MVYAHLDAKEGDEILITTTPPKHCRWNSLLMMCKCYIQNSKMLGTCTLACFIAEILMTVQYPPTGLHRDWSTPIWHREMVLLSPCSQILCLFLSSPDKEEHTASATTQEVSQLVFSSNYLQLQVCGLCYLYYYGPTLYQLHRFRCLRNCI